MKKYFITSDIHSFYSELMAALNKQGFDKDNPEHILCVCGDLFDRGEETVKLFEFVKELSAQSRLIYVRGNHEDMLFDCVNELRKNYTPGHHHFHNGTIKTICQFCGESEWIIYDPSWRNKIVETMGPILEFIDKNSVNYAEIKDYVLVHGWWPAYDTVEYYSAAEDYQWKEARWENGMEMWRNPNCRIPNKTVICGHWHCSWGWSHIDQKYKEFPQPTHEDFELSFQPWIKEGIIAIDACTAYSGQVNVLVIEE